MTVERRANLVLVTGAVAFALSLAAFGGEVASHGKHVLSWFDLSVYYHSGFLARHDPQALYRWQLRPGDGFTYTPFAAVLFAAVSVLPLLAVRWLMTAGSIVALVATVWLTATALGWSGRKQMGLALALSAGLLWLEPVMKALKLGQIELLLLALVVWDLGRVNRGRPGGGAIGLAAAIKLVPLIFIVYLALCGKARAAVRAAVVFVLSIVVGFLALPAQSQTWWFHGQVVHAGHEVNVGEYLNQSLLGLLSRVTGSVSAATPVWLVVATVVFIGGLATAVRLHRLGQPVAGWLACALTGLLVSPISWDHHWVWVVPLLVYGVHLALTERTSLRWLAAAGTGVTALIYFGLPSDRGDPSSLIPARLLLGRSSAGNSLVAYHLHRWQLITWDLYVLTGIALLLIAGLATSKVIGGPEPAPRRGAPRPGLPWRRGSKSRRATRPSTERS
jgi:alpha-1,2-mannosyltransferase